MVKRPETIVDAHHHLWNPVSGEPYIGYVWLRDIGAAKPFGDPTAIQRDYLLEEFAAEPAPSRLAASVHLQADGAIADPVSETRFIQELSEASEFPIAIVGFADLSKDSAQKVIERHMRSRNFRGVRQILSRLDDRQDISFAPMHCLRDARWREQIELLEENRLSFDLQLYPEQMPEAAEFFARYPNIPVIVDHAGSPWDQSKNGFSRWRNGIALLADLPQVSLKLGGFGMFDPNWSAASIRPMFEHAAEQFGYHRMMFASNFPVDKLMRSYADILSDMAVLTADATEDDRAAFFAGNARAVYRI